MIRPGLRDRRLAEVAFFVVLLAGLLAAGRSGFFHDPGTFWHTVVGERILSMRTFPDSDAFSFTFAGKPWVPYEWLGECLMAVLHRWGGFDALLLASAVLLAGLYAWAAGRLVRGGLHGSLALVLTALAVAASSSHFHARPHLGTIVLLGLLVALLCDFEAGRIGLGRLAWLVPGFVLWTNLHGGMLGGLGTLALAAAAWILLWLLAGKGPVQSARQAIFLTLLVAACGLTAFINPYGTRLPRTWLEIMEAAALPRIIQEHAPLDPGRPDGWIVLAFGVVYGFALAGVWPVRPRVTWLLPFVWLYLTGHRVRHAPLYSVTALVALADLLPYTRWARWLARPGSDLFRFPPSNEAVPRWNATALLMPLTALLIGVGVQRLGLPLLGLGTRWARLDAAEWPTELLPELARYENSRPGGTPIFNEYALGGFLIYYSPGYRVFVDDRCELYGGRWLEDYVRAEQQDAARYVADWQAWAAGSGGFGPFRLALTHTGSGFDRYFRSAPDWIVVGQTPAASLYRHRKGIEPGG